MDFILKLVANYLGPVSGAIVIVFFTYRIKTLEQPAKVLFYLSIFSLLTDCVTSVLAELKMNNLLAIHMYTTLEILLYCLFYSLLFNTPKSKRLLISLAIVLLATEFFDAFYLSKLSHINSIASYCEALGFMIVSLLFFFSLMKNLPEKNILDYPLFWFNAGVLIYFSGTLFLYLFIDIIRLQSVKIAGELWIINSFLYFAYNLFVTVGAWKSRK